jgi:hypothetical protein
VYAKTDNRPPQQRNSPLIEEEENQTKSEPKELKMGETRSTKTQG